MILNGTPIVGPEQPVHGNSAFATAHTNSNKNGKVYDEIHQGLSDVNSVYAKGPLDSSPGNHVNYNTIGSRIPPAPIAICGLAMRLPGGIRNADTFWELLRDGKDMRGPIPPDRYNVEGFSGSLGEKGATKTPFGYFLEEKLACLDTSFFTMTRSELERADPQQRQLLEVTRECLENAGEVNYRGKSIGCYVGTFGEDWLQMSAKESQHSGGYVLTGHSDLMIANRVSFEYDFQGPSMVIKTGCSASLVGLHEACRALQSGDCSAAIVAGTNLIMGPTTTIAMTQEGILSPEGSCKTFDAGADGFARGEAISVVFIKRLDQAILDRSPIRAIIRNTATNSDGKSAGLMTPNSKSHEALMRKVYLDAGLDPGDTAFVECHGTGTPTGDPIETAAVGNVFGGKGVYIGSVKPNVGHAEGASGITSLIKAVLALEHKTIPPNIKFTKPNPKIHFDKNNLQVPIKALPWPLDRVERISINSFGIGGSNAHVILDSAADIGSEGDAVDTSEVTQAADKLLLFSANSQDSLRQLLVNFHEYIDFHPQRLSHIAYTLALRREHLPYRSFVIAGGQSKSSGSSPAKIPTNAPDIVLTFSGQGAQWPQMGRELLRANERFRRDIKAMDRFLQTLTHPPQWTIEEELQKPTDTSQLARAEFAQPLCTAIQIALANEMVRCGVRPKAVIGHSSGEIAAAYASGAVTLPAALIISYYRGYVTKNQRLVGGMAAIGLGPSAVSAFLEDGVVIACENSPTSTTISGDLEKVKKVVARIKVDKPETLARLLKVDMAYHSHHMKPLSSLYKTLVQEEFSEQQILLQKQAIRLFSSVTNNVIETSILLGPDYWEANLRSPVLFSSAASNVLRHQANTIFLEIGPHATLAGPLRQVCAGIGCPFLYVPTMLRNGDSVKTLLSAFGQLYQHGISVDYERLVPSGKVLTDLPAYPWQHNAEYWYENRVSKDWRFRKYGHHSILGLRVPESTSMEPYWRNILHLEDEPWLYDHKIRSDVVFPFAGYVAMAGEAVRQMTGIDTGYSLRNVVAHTALVLSDSKPVEMVTTLRPHKLTDSNNSDSYDFAISSHSGSSWIKNCEGTVKPFVERIQELSPSGDVLRKVAPSKWYEIMAHIGLVYGPEFQGLTKIASSTTKCLAIGEITTSKAQHVAPFLFHPAAIDACLQLSLVALAKGVGRNFAQLSVPTLIEELDVSKASLRMDAVAHSSNDWKVIGVECVADGTTVLRLSGVHLTPLDDEKAMAATDQYAAARLEWCPHFDFMDIRPLFKPPKSDKEETYMQEEMSLLCMVDSAERLKYLDTDQPHFYKFRDWLNMEIHRAEVGTYPLLKDSASLLSVSPRARREMIEERFTRLITMSEKSSVAEGIMRIWDNMEAIFTGKADTLDILMRDDLLTKIYDVVSFGHGEFVRILSHARPNLRILEVGAGTGGTTELILHDLVDLEGYPAYSVYTFTDISAGFFPQARERFAYASNMDYKVFDISRSPFEQGFEAASFDLILAPNVIHATPCLVDTLSNLQPLLRPEGHLVLTELSAVVRTPNYIFGNFSGWWLGEEDGRPYEPYISVCRWDQELKAAGFTGVETAIYDAEEPYQYCAAIVTQPKSPTEMVPPNQCVTLLCDQPGKGVSQGLIAHLQVCGWNVSVCRLGELPRQGQDIISSLDLEDPFFQAITEERLSAFQDILRNNKSQKFLWLTKPAQVDCRNPRSAHSIGVARTIRSELAIPFHTLEINETEDDFSNLVMKIFTKIQRTEDSESLLPDREYIVDDGAIKIGRYHPFSLLQELSQSTEGASGRITTLEIAKPGLLQTLQWKEKAPTCTVPDGSVEVETRAVGLNFRDIVLSMGVMSSGSGNIPLGFEVTGLIRRIGCNVHNVAVGDRIFALTPEGCISTTVILPATLCVKVPNSLSFDEAATMPVCFATAIHSLVDVGQLEKGQAVLIHSACCGVGHAAIQICRLIGAEIFATVGSKEKVQYLNETMGIPMDHIYNSRDESFGLNLMAATGGRGVDIVLNSLSGDLLPASWKCVAHFGKMIEIGKRDLAGFEKLRIEVVLKNRSYCCVDMRHLAQEKPEKMGRVLEKCLEMYQHGEIHPIRPVAFFDASDIERSFRYLQNGDHIGKVVVRMPKNASDIVSAPLTRNLVFDPEASYLLVGGLGGLGKVIASWMVERGGRSLIFLSRNAGSSDEDRDFFVVLESLGCSVSAIAGQVQDIQDVARVLSSASKPIKGVVHLAMVLRDAPIIDMSHADWTTVIAPKVEGAWNLHNTFIDHPLDFFFMASSLVTIVDMPGQGNYQAANTFLEAFCQYRHSLGLPASVLNICPINGIGFVAENPIARKNLKSQGLYFLGEQDFLHYVELAIFCSQPNFPGPAAQHPFTSWKSTGQLVMGLRSELHLDDPNNRTNWRRDRRMAIYHNVRNDDLGQNPSTTSNALKDFLSRAADDPDILGEKASAEFFAHEIGRKVLDFMLKPDKDVDITLDLTQIGLDSLMAIELRRWWKQAFKLEISMLEIMASGTLEALGAAAAEGVRTKLVGER